MTDEDDEGPPQVYAPQPQQWENTKIFYKALWDSSEPVVVDGMECRRWKGGLRNFLIQVCGNGAHYGKIVNYNLEGMGCIEIESKGGGRGKPTEVLLIMDPETARQNPVAARKARRFSDTTSTQGQLKVIFHRLDEQDKEIVRLHREVQHLKGERPREDYVPSPDPRRSPTAQLKSLVDFAQDLGVEFPEEEDG